MPNTTKPNLIEYAGTTGGRDYTRGFVGAIHKWLPSQDSLLQQKSGGDLELYEVVATDDQVKSCLQQRFRALLAKDWEVIPGGDKRIDKQAAEHLEKQLEAINWDDCNEKMLWGIHYGYSAAEVLYARDGEKVVIADIKVRNRRRFHFNDEQRLVLKTMQNPLGEDLPERKFWHFCTGADHDDEPYGRGLGHWLYWPTFFKRNGVRWWMKFVEKYAQPTRLGKYPAGATQNEKDTLWNALGSFGDDARSMIPEGLEMEFLESSRAGTVDYKSLCDQMDAAIAKIILSQTMTTDDGSSKSQAEVHDGVKDEVIESDSDLLCESFNNSVAVWLTDWNYPGAAYPKVRRKIQADPDPATMAETDTKLQGLGISLKPEAIAAKYGEDYLVPDNADSIPQLNGEQVNALVSIITNAKQGGWSAELVAGMINGAFPNWPDDAVAAITENLEDATVADPNNPQAPSDPQTPKQSAQSLDDVAAQFAAPAKKKNCKTGISCGNACISALKTCKKPLTDEQKEMKPPIVASAGVEVKAKTKAKTKTKPELSDAEKEAIATKTDAQNKPAIPKAEEPKVEPKSSETGEEIKGLKFQLLSMANGADPDSIEISNEDIEYARKKFMDKQGNEYVSNKTEKMKSESPNLFDDEALALSTWIGHKYASMNAILYGGKLDYGVDAKAVGTTDLLAAKALHKLPPATQEQITSEAKKKNEPFDPKKPLGRYMTVDNPEEFVKRYQDALAGDGEVRESTFFATSHIDREDFSFCNIDTNLTYEVKAKLDGTGNGRYIDHYKNTMSEGELLYPPESKFRVVAVVPPTVTGKGNKIKEYQPSSQEKSAKAKKSVLTDCKIAAMNKAGKVSGKVYESELAKVYQEKTGEPLPSKKEQEVINASAQAVSQKAENYKLKQIAMQGGKNRNRNWIIQLEEI